ncbi:MAG TPA: hypothetical protein VGC42_21885 [Kofleriaceae bacterium]
MKSTTITSLLLGLLAQAGCGDGGSGNSGGNPAALWLAPDMMETRIKLVEQEPVPF